MSRFLFVTLPLAGHAYAAVAVADALRRHGHEVAWAGPERYLRPLVGPETAIYPTGMRPYRGPRDRGLHAVKSLWEGFVVPFARFMLPAVEKAAEAYEPDAMVVDQHALAGGAVAQRRGLPWATLVTQQMELTRPFATLPKVEGWFRDHVTRIADTAGLTGSAAVDLRFSPRLVLALSSELLTDRGKLAPQVELVGPVLSSRPADAGFAWPGSWDRTRPTILVSMGTLAQDLAAGFYGRMAAALAPLAGRLQAIVVAPAEALPDPPPHVLVIPRVPTLELLPEMAAVVSHAGHNTVCEALAHAVPLVVAPIKYDQPVVARQVVEAGAGIRLRFARARPEQLREAVLRVIEEPGYRQAAARVRDSFTAAGGATAAVAHLEKLVSS